MHRVISLIGCIIIHTVCFLKRRYHSHRFVLTELHSKMQMFFSCMYCNTCTTLFRKKPHKIIPNQPSTVFLSLSEIHLMRFLGTAGASNEVFLRTSGHPLALPALTGLTKLGPRRPGPHGGRWPDLRGRRLSGTTARGEELPIAWKMVGGPRDLCTLAKMAKNQRGSGDSRKNSGDEPKSWWSVFPIERSAF